MRRVTKRIVNKVAPSISNLKNLLYLIKNDTTHIINLMEDQNARTHTPSNQLKMALEGVEPYQPIFGLTGFLKDVARDNSAERCERIFSALRRDVQNLRILDVGSSLGYVPFYFADKGARTTGWDTDPKNIEVCNIAKQINGITNADFVTKHFDSATLKDLKSNSYDVVLLLSVIHHILHQRGLKETKLLMKNLLEKVSVLIVELAVKEEFESRKNLKKNDQVTIDRMSKWEGVLPDNPLAIFEGIDGVEIKHLGEFETHLSKTKRPMYMVTRKIVSVGNRPYTYELSKKAAYKNSTAAGSRIYYHAKDYFIKEYQFDSDDNENFVQIIGELNVLLMLRRKDYHTPHIPALYDFAVETDRVKLVLESIKGDVLFGMNYVLETKEVEKTMCDVACALYEVEKLGIHHNDIRPWNIMRDASGTVKLIDFGNASPEERENNVAAFLWTATYYLENSWPNDFDARTLPSKDYLEKSRVLTKIFEKARKNKSMTFHEIYNEMKA